MGVAGEADLDNATAPPTRAARAFADAAAGSAPSGAEVASLTALLTFSKVEQTRLLAAAASASGKLGDTTDVVGAGPGEVGDDVGLLRLMTPTTSAATAISTPTVASGIPMRLLDGRRLAAAGGVHCPAGGRWGIVTQKG